MYRLVLFFLVAFLSHREAAVAQHAFNDLPGGVWVIDSICEPEYVWHRNPAVAGDDSAFYIFEPLRGGDCFGDTGKAAMICKVRGVTRDSRTGALNAVIYSCPDIYSLLGDASIKEPWWTVCGEHWPYIARFQPLDANRFSLTSDFGMTNGNTTIRYYRRIPVPAFLKEN